MISYGSQWINPASVIANGGGLYQNGYIQPNPIGNVMNIGGMGYNNYGFMGGYYNPYNGGYYNPYLIHQQQQRMLAIQKEEERKQADTWKNLSRKVNGITNTVEDIEDHVKKYDPIDTVTDPDYLERQQNLRMVNLYYNGIDTQSLYYMRQQQMFQMMAKAKEQYPDDMTLGEFLDKAGDMLYEARMNKRLKEQRDLSKLYNSNQYKQLAKLHSNNMNYFNSIYSGNPLNNPVNIDDMEITLPGTLSEYDQRRKAFLESIFK